MEMLLHIVFVVALVDNIVVVAVVVVVDVVFQL